MTSGKIEIVKDVDSIKILKITGVFAKETIPDMQKVCNQTAQDKGTKAVLLDLKDVEEIDTSAFACMINFIKDYMPKGIRIGMFNLQNKGKMLTELLKIDGAIKTFQSESQAVDAFSKK